MDYGFEITKLVKDLKDGDTITLKNKEYHIYPDFLQDRVICVSNNDMDGFKKTAFLIENKKNITVDGNGAKLIFHGIVNPFFITNSKNIIIKNLSVDFEEIMYLHAKVTEVGNGYFCIKPILPKVTVIDGRLYGVSKSYTGIVKGISIDINPKTKDLREGIGDWVLGDYPWKLDYYAEQVGENEFKITSDEFTEYPVCGDIFLWGFGKRFAPAVIINESENVLLDCVTLYSAQAMGVLAQLSKDITVKKLAVRPSGDRYVSLYADGVHFSECYGELVLDECDIRNQMDDALNCHGIYGQIIRFIDKKTVAVRFVKSDQRGLKIYNDGDRAELIDCETLITKAENTIQKADYISREIVILTFEKELQGINLYDVIENVSHVSNLTVKNCHFSGNRARGILISTRGKVEVADNEFNVSGAAIRISGDAASWFESGCVKDLIVRNNRFKNCNRCPGWGNAVIDIAPEIDNPSETEYYHSGINICNNTFDVTSTPVLYAKSVDGLNFTDNIINGEQCIITETCKNCVFEEE